MRVVRAGHGFKPERWLFRELSFTLAPGRVAAVLGPNGCGKTTLLRALCGTLHLREGEVEVDGPVGYVPQALLPDAIYTAHEMVLLGRSRHIGRFGAPGRRDRARAEACLAEVGLGDLAGQRYDRLSGGQRQLVLLARALATDCSVLILDEPASALDLANQGVVLGLIERLAAARGLAVLVTTHHPDHALAVAHDALVFAGDPTPIFGPAREVLTDAILSRVYGVPVRRLELVEGGRVIETVVPIHALQGRPVTAPL